MDSSSSARALNDSERSEKAQGDLSGQFSTTWTIALAVLMALLIVATVVGNALVMLAFVVDSSLRTQNNYFLLNLAISDFLVGKVPHLVSASLHPEIMIRLRAFWTLGVYWVGCPSVLTYKSGVRFIICSTTILSFVIGFQLLWVTKSLVRISPIHLPAGSSF